MPSHKGRKYRHPKALQQEIKIIQIKRRLVSEKEAVIKDKKLVTLPRVPTVQDLLAEFEVYLTETKPSKSAQGPVAVRDDIYLRNPALWTSDLDLDLAQESFQSSWCTIQATKSTRKSIDDKCFDKAHVTLFTWKGVVQILEALFLVELPHSLGHAIHIDDIFEDVQDAFNAPAKPKTTATKVKAKGYELIAQLLYEINSGIFRKAKASDNGPNSGDKGSLKRALDTVPEDVAAAFNANMGASPPKKAKSSATASSKEGVGRKKPNLRNPRVKEVTDEDDETEDDLPAHQNTAAPNAFGKSPTPPSKFHEAFGPIRFKEDRKSEVQIQRRKD
ncbi:hypothetical protein B0H13DRAFT_1882080 [Mycena leptocephala]|nr:hypothetical protein B0H13DRAFT_1882080 [Mycena leptocephala]